MSLKLSSSRHVCTCVCVLLAALTITVIVCSIILRIYLIKQVRKQVFDYYDDESNESSSYDDYVEAKLKTAMDIVDSIIFIKERVEKMNKEQRISNVGKFGPVKPTTFTIVIQVHENTAFLKVLLASLKKVVGITQSLLIFCHDYYDNNINSIIRGVHFARYMQVFYPYSSQIYPMMYPGSDSKFCSNDFNCSDACTDYKKECYRSAALVQQKHFWWWHVNFVFDHLKVTKNHIEPIMFLEENQFVLEDFLFLLKVLISLMPAHCPECEIIHFGAPVPELSEFRASYGKVTIDAWNPALPGIGIAFNKTVWKTIQNSSYDFCHFDDHRWDASLNNLSNKRSKGPLLVITVEAPRVLQIQLCDGSVADCTLARTIEDLHRFTKSIHRGLYPQNLVISTADTQIQNVNASGQWKDVRDPALCMYLNMV